MALEPFDMHLSREILEVCSVFILNHNSPLTSGSPFYPRPLPDMPGVQKVIDMLIIIGHQLESYLMKLDNTVMIWEGCAEF